ncbi:MAG: hypothetical protein EBZ78_03745 [Verrucomicrobia bacterium]|nr:hypothetical protein [Verrucomicrobiota bacterium]
MPAGWTPLFASLALGVLLTVCLFRQRWIHSLYACWALGGGFCLLLYLSWSNVADNFEWTRLVSLVFLLVPFFHILNMAATARRVRICVALARHPGGLSENKLIRILQLKSMTVQRVQILKQFGQIDQIGKQVTLVRAEFLILAHILNLLKRILQIPLFLDFEKFKHNKRKK